VSAHERKAYSSVVLQLLEQSSTIEEVGNEIDGESSDGDTASDPESVQELASDIIAHLDTAIRCLNDLNKSLAAAESLTAVPDFNSDNIAQEFQDISPHHFSFCIRERFPDVSHSIAEHLGRANLSRYQELHALRTRADQSLVPIDLTASESASTAAMSKFQGSGYGSAVNPSTYAPSVAHSATSSILSEVSQNGGSKYPTLPEEAKSGSPFECAACGSRIVARKKSEYR
jgi:hypothetical protein